MGCVFKKNAGNGCNNVQSCPIGVKQALQTHVVSRDSSDDLQNPSPAAVFFKGCSSAWPAPWRVLGASECWSIQWKSHGILKSHGNPSTSHSKFKKPLVCLKGFFFLGDTHFWLFVPKWPLREVDFSWSGTKCGMCSGTVTGDWSIQGPLLLHVASFPGALEYFLMFWGQTSLGWMVV